MIIDVSICRSVCFSPSSTYLPAHLPIYLPIDKLSIYESTIIHLSTYHKNQCPSVTEQTFAYFRNNMSQSRPPHLTRWHRAQSGQHSGHGRNQRGRFILLLHGVIVIGPWAPSTISRSPDGQEPRPGYLVNLDELGKTIFTVHDCIYQHIPRYAKIYQLYQVKVMLCVLSLWILVIFGPIFGYNLLPEKKSQKLLNRSSFDLDHPLRFHSAGAVSSTYPPGSKWLHGSMKPRWLPFEKETVWLRRLEKRGKRWGFSGWLLQRL